MKSLLLTLSIFAGTALATQAQTKMQVESSPDAVATESEIGPGKFTEIEPFAYTANRGKKKISLTTNAKRTEPVLQPAANTPVLAGDGKTRVEGKLADNGTSNAEAPAFK